jgi:UDP-sugar pyrophosphorylase
MQSQEEPKTGQLDQSGVIALLAELDQNHILSEFEKRSEEEKLTFIEQVNNLERIYPGGLREYVKRAKVLLHMSKHNINPYADYTPSIPEGTNIKVGDAEYFKLEAIGFKELMNTSFVLVAGGLGERLGYDDIKIGIPTELVTKRTFFQLYVDYLKAYQVKLRRQFNITEEDWYIPLCIMTSDDTHSKTVKLLEDNKNFGLREGQVEIVKQEKVPALLDNDCHFAIQNNSLLIDTKPHGHGDIHTLLHQSGVAERWLKLGKKWVVFFQDTNALAFNSFPSALGVSASNNFVINTITIPRKPGEAVGGICKLTGNDGKNITLNVEYNQLDALLRDKYNPNGDVANENGLSDFPGNTNVLVFELNTYVNTLNKTKGLIPEFVNPKYADETKTVFKSATRLECMMQDFPKLLTNNEIVGFTMYDRWFCFSTCKNNLKEGTDKLKKNQIPETAFSVEQDLFKANQMLIDDVLKKLKIVKTEEPGIAVESSVDVLGVKVYFGHKIIIHPSFAVTLAELNEKISGEIRMTEDSTLILEGDQTSVTELNLDGYLHAKEGIVQGEVKNFSKFVYLPLKENEGENYEKIRGYTSTKISPKEN